MIAPRRHDSRLSCYVVLPGLLLAVTPSLSGAQGARKPAPPAAQQIAAPMKFLHWAPPQDPPVAAFVNVNVIPMDHDGLYPSQTVVIRE